MPGPRSPSERKRRRRAKAIVDFATGEVHDRALDAAGDPHAIAQAQGTADPVAAPDALSPEELPNEDRAAIGIDGPERGRRARRANQQSRRRWVKARKIP
jgi:hypothetical protein